MAQRITTALLYQELQAIKEQIETHTQVDNGNFRELKQILEGSESAPGMKIRVDRLEQVESLRQKKEVDIQKKFGYIWASLSAIVSGAILKIWWG